MTYKAAYEEAVKQFKIRDPSDLDDSEQKLLELVAQVYHLPGYNTTKINGATVSYETLAAAIRKIDPLGFLNVAAYLEEQVSIKNWTKYAMATLYNYRYERLNKNGKSSPI